MHVALCSVRLEGFVCFYSNSCPKDTLGMLSGNNQMPYNLVFQTDPFLWIMRLFFHATLLSVPPSLPLSNLYLLLSSQGMLSDVSVACKCSPLKVLMSSFLFRYFWKTEKHFYCSLFDNDLRLELDLAGYGNPNLCVNDINTLVYYKSVQSGLDGYMSINSPNENQTTKGISCVYPGLCVFYRSSFEPRVMCHCSNASEEVLYVNSSSGFLRFPVVNIKNIKSYVGGWFFVSLMDCFVCVCVCVCGDLRWHTYLWLFFSSIIWPEFVRRLFMFF